VQNLHRDLTLQGLDKLTHQAEIEAERQTDGQYHVQITTSSQAVVMGLEVLRLAMLVADRVYSSIDRAALAHRSDETVRALREKEKAVAEQYWIYRDQGMKHRVAIDCTVQISEVAQQQGWSKQDVGYCVRLFPREYFQLNLPKQEEGHATIGWEGQEP
jgi:hypothetical protein